MISNKEFEKIDKEVQESVSEAFDHIKDNCIDHDYILYLADGEYKERYKGNHLKLNPYTIDNREDKYKDESRMNFFIRFMQLSYSFPEGTSQTEDNEERLHMELMVYTHIWESKPFLKQLFRLASLVDGKSYAWSVKVPDWTKHEFIRKDIRDVLAANNLKLADVMSKGFRSQLRNAFSHSEYVFDNHNKLIHLDNYKGEDKWEMKNISYNEWTKKFAYSALLSYHLIKEKYKKRSSLISDFGKDKFLIILPINSKKFRTVYVQYREEYDNFNFIQH